MSANPATAGKVVEPARKEQPRPPRRIVLLAGDEQSEVEEVLGEYTGAESKSNGLHDHIQHLAQQHRGRWVAGEWLSTLGWTRFLWARK